VATATQAVTMKARRPVDPLRRAKVPSAPIPRKITPELTRAVQVMLRKSSILAVKYRFKLPHRLVRGISKESKARFQKLGRGRLIPKEVQRQIIGALKAHKSKAEIRRTFGVSLDFIQKVRRQIGDTEDRRLRRSWDAAKVRRSLKKGLSVTEVERECGIQHAVLWKFRKKIGDLEDRRRRGKPMPPEKKAAILADIRAGLCQRALAEKWHVHADAVRQLQIGAGVPLNSPRTFTIVEVLKIRELFSQGKTDGEIARELRCTRGAVWFRRKRESEFSKSMEGRNAQTNASRDPETYLPA
jgi:hypothetical protein